MSSQVQPAATAELVGKGTTYNIEGFTATDETNDLALLKVTAYGIKPLPLGNSTDVRIGETVYVAGSLMGLLGTFYDGIISSRRDKYAKERLQMTAPISPWSSGGPVLNSKGEVIGVAFRMIEDGQNLDFAIPAIYLKTLLTLSKPAKPLAHGNQTVSAETYFRRGYMMYELERYQEAIVAYNKAIQLKPDYATAYRARGMAKAFLGQHFAAISDYDKAIQLKPDYAMHTTIAVMQRVISINTLLRSAIMIRRYNSNQIMPCILGSRHCKEGSRSTLCCD